MTFIIIFLILLLQYYFKLAATAPWRQSSQAAIWQAWTKLATAVSLQQKPVFSALGFIALVMIIVAALYHLLGFIAAFVLLWFACDAFPAPAEDDEVVYRFRHLFAIWFWFVILGIYPAMLYFAIVLAYENLPSLKDVTWFEQSLSLLEWIPVRLLGLSLGLVSSLMPVLAQWLKDMRFALSSQADILRNWTDLAVKADGEASIQRLLIRVGLLWLVILALLSIGSYVV